MSNYLNKGIEWGCRIMEGVSKQNRLGLDSGNTTHSPHAEPRVHQLDLTEKMLLNNNGESQRHGGDSTRTRPRFDGGLAFAFVDVVFPRRLGIHIRRCRLLQIETYKIKEHGSTSSIHDLKYSTILNSIYLYP